MHEVSRMVEIVDRRYCRRSEFVTDAQLRRVSAMAAGSLRDCFRMLRIALPAVSRTERPATDEVIGRAERALRSDWIAEDDRDRLRYIDRERRPMLPSLDELPEIARLQQSNCVLHEDEWSVHPLLRKPLGLG